MKFTNQYNTPCSGCNTVPANLDYDYTNIRCGNCNQIMVTMPEDELSAADVSRIQKEVQNKKRRNKI